MPLGIRWLLYLMQPLVWSAVGQFQVQQLSSLRSVVQDEFLRAAELALGPSNPETSFQKSVDIFGTYLQRRAGSDLSDVSDFLQNQSSLGDSIKALMPLVIQPLALMSGTCPANSTRTTRPRVPSQRPNSRYPNVAWEAKFTALLTGGKSFQGTVGLNTEGKSRSGFGLEIQQHPVPQSYSLGMQWLFRRSIEGFTFTVAVSSPILQDIGIVDIDLIYSHPNWQCLSRCNEATLSEDTDSEPDPTSDENNGRGRYESTRDADKEDQSGLMKGANVTTFMKGIVFQGFGLTFRRFNKTIPTLQPIIDSIPASVTTLLSSPVKAHLLQIQNQLKTQQYGGTTSNISVAIGDVANIWNSGTRYEGISSAYCPGCGDILDNCFMVDSTSELCAFEGMMTNGYIDTPLRIGVIEGMGLISGVEGQALIGFNSTCNATKVSLKMASIRLGALPYILKDSFAPSFINETMGSLGDAAGLSLHRATMDITVTNSDTFVTVRGVPWLPAGAQNSTNPLLQIASAVSIASLQFTVSAKFQTEFLLNVTLNAAVNSDPGRIIRVVSSDGSGLALNMMLRFFAAENQVSQDIRTTVPLAICVANCTSNRGQQRLLYFNGDGRVEGKNLVGTLYSKNDWSRALGFDFLQVNAMTLALQWPLTLSRPTAAQWTGTLCLGTVQNCAKGGSPSIKGVAFFGLDEVNVMGNYFVATLENFTLGTLAAVVVPGASLAAPFLQDAWIIPESEGQSTKFKVQSSDNGQTLGNALASGQYVLRGAPVFGNSAVLPTTLQLKVRLVVLNLTFNVTINVARNGLQVKGTVPLWCLNINGECVMHLGHTLEACRAVGSPQFMLSLSARAQQSVPVQITGAMDIPMLMGCGYVGVRVQNDNTFRYSGPFNLFNGTWMPNVNISWPASGTSFLVEMGSIAFVNNIPILTDVRYYYDDSSAPGNDFVTLKATWRLFNFNVPDVEIVFSDMAISFMFETDILQGIDPLLQGSQYDVTGSGDASASGKLEDTAFQIQIMWTIEGALNALIQETIVKQAIELAGVMNNVTAQVDSMFAQVKDIFNTTLLPIRPKLAWGLTSVSEFLSSAFEDELKKYDGEYLPEPFVGLSGNGGTVRLTGASNEYGCALYQYNYSECTDILDGNDNCIVRSYGPYGLSGCVMPRVWAMSVVKALHMAMMLRQAELELTKTNNPSLVAIARSIGALPSDSATVSVSGIVPYIPLGAIITIRKAQAGSRRLMQDEGPASMDISRRKTRTATPTQTFPKARKLAEKFAVQEAAPATMPSDPDVSFTYPLDITDAPSFENSLHQGALAAAIEIASQLLENERGTVTLQSFAKVYMRPFLSPAENVSLPCTTTIFSVTPPALTVDEACKDGARVQVIGIIVEPGAQCGDTVAILQWQGQANATCSGSLSDVVEQQVTFLGVKKLGFDTFPNNVTILNVDPAQANFTGIPTSSVTCGISVSITFSDAAPTQLSPGEWLIDRTWSIAPADANCPDPEQNDQYVHGLTYTQLQVIIIQDLTPPVFTETPPAVVVLEQGVIPSTSVTGTPRAEDPIHPDLLARGVARNNVTLTFSDTIIPKPDLEVEGHIGVVEYQRKWQAEDLAGNKAFFDQIIYVKTNQSPDICKECISNNEQCPEELTPSPSDLYFDVPHCGDPVILAQALSQYGCEVSTAEGCKVVVCTGRVPDDAIEQLQSLQCGLR